MEIQIDISSLHHRGDKILKDFNFENFQKAKNSGEHKHYQHSPEDLQFWGERFIEHTNFIKSDLLKHFRSSSVLKNLVKKLDTLEKDWSDILKCNAQTTNTSINTLDNISDKSAEIEIFELSKLAQLIAETIYVKSEFKTIFLEFKIPCAPALLEHMQEEVEYFRDCLLLQKWSFAAEMGWWANEHKENILFIDCQFPHSLRQKSGKKKSLEKLERILSDNTKLSNTFDSIQSRLMKSECVTYEILQEMAAVKAKHLKMLDALIVLTDKLPFSKEEKGETVAMLTHERKEAIFANKRIGKRAIEHNL